MLDSLFSLRRVLFATTAVIAVLLAIGWATREDPAERPYLDIVGGGFIFNYRIAEVFYGFTVVVLKPLPTGSVVEASFEDPAGGKPYLVRQRLGGPEMTRFAMRSPPVRGVKAGQPYLVIISVLAREGEKVLWTAEREFRSQLDGNLVPDQPLTIGPGYAPNRVVSGRSHFSPLAPPSRIPH